MKVSIIIPIYNGEKYIPVLYERLKSQSFQDFELLYIDDGSNDHSYELLRHLAENDSKIKLFHRTNHGICASRNLGISYASGDYIIFLDQDDMIDLHLVEMYVKDIEEKKTDLSIFGKKHYYIEDSKIKKEVLEIYDDIIVSEKEEIIKRILNVENKKELMTIWNCIYKREIIQKNNIRFDSHFKSGFEDGMFNAEYAIHCHSISFNSSYYYHYYIRKGESTISKYNENYYTDISYFSQKLYILLENCLNDTLKNMYYLYVLRFFVNIYRNNFHSQHKTYYQKKLCLQKMVSNQYYHNALNYSWKNSTNRKLYYLYYYIYASLLRHKFYFLCILMLDFLFLIKRI